MEALGGVFATILECLGKDFTSLWRTWCFAPNFGGQNQAKPFMGFAGFFLRSWGLIWRNFLSTRDGVSSNIFIGYSAVCWSSARNH